MILEFADEAKLYVPLTRLDLIQKYRSTDTGPAPQLNKLGTQAWQKTKARVKKAMADMSAELLKLYAQRRAAVGTAFSPDTNMQREFEDAFDFNETDDQITAIADIKLDMESPQPMDRLLAATLAMARPRSPCARRSRPCRTATGRRPHAHNGARLPALRDLQAPLRQVPGQCRDDLALPHAQRSRRTSSRKVARARWTSSSARIACSPGS